MELTTRPDVVVIGSGAGGAAVAWRLVSEGAQVLLLEAGPRFDPATDYALTDPDWERHRFPEKPGSMATILFDDLGPVPEADDLPRSENVVWGALTSGAQRKAAGQGVAHVQAFGGTTLRFVGEAHRLHPDAFRLQSLTGQGADWPLTYQDLESYYALCENLIGVAGPISDSSAAPFPLPPHPLSPGAERLAAAGARLGQSWQANSRSALSVPYDDRPACNYCGNCSRGCPIGDKGSADVTFLRHAERTGRLQVLTDCQATRIETGPNGNATAVYCVIAGQQHRIETPILVLACGAVQTPRLLLASASTEHPNGLANGSDQVGRNFLETLFWNATGLAPNLKNSHMGLPADAVCWDYAKPTSGLHVAGGYRLSHATQEIGFVGPIAYGTRLIPGSGAQFQARLRQAFGSAVTVAAMGETIGDPRSALRLSADQSDAAGMPLPVLSSVLTENSLNLLREMSKTGRAVLREAGVAQILEESTNADRFYSTHVYGTCRMAADAKDGVVDQSGRSFDIGNLYIADASVFPSTGGGEAPSLTINAIGVRTADAILA